MPFWANKNSILQFLKGNRQGSSNSSRAVLIYPISLFIILAAVYGKTIATGLSWANGGTDGGDLITAAAVHGVAHPSGYPTYLTLAWIFQQIPLGSLAFRTNLLSAICMILAVLILFFTCRHLFEESPFSNLSAWVTSLTFGISPLAWSQAVITEVYALQALFTVVILYQTFSGSKFRTHDYSRGLVMGLSLGNQLTSLFMVPLLFWNGKSIFPELLRHIPKRLFGLITGSSIYLLLPLWASGKPPINWGNPVTLKALISLISGEIYQSNFTLIFSIDRLRGLIGILMEQFSIAGLIVGLFFLFGAWRQIKTILPLFWVFFVYAFFSIIYGSFDSYVYLIPSVMAFCIWIGFGFQEITQSIVTHWKFGFIATIFLLFIAIGYHLIHTMPKVDASQDQRAEIFGQTILNTLPQNAIVITENDEATFSLWYFHFGLKMRNDISVVANGLLPYGWYVETLKQTYPELNIPQPDTSSLIDSIIEANPSRTVCKIGSIHAINLQCFPTF